MMTKQRRNLVLQLSAICLVLAGFSSNGVADEKLKMKSTEGTGQLYQKLVVISDLARYRKTADESGEAKSLAGWSIWYRLRTDDGKDEVNGKYRFGWKNGKPIGYVKKEFVEIWNTRTVLAPVGTTAKKAFVLYSDKAGENVYKKYTGDEAAKGKSDKMLALVTGMPDSNASKAVYKVIAWTVRY